MDRDNCSVKVDNIAEGVSRHGIVALFNKLIGEVRKCEQKKNESGASSFELCFNSYDDAKKALCMSGYNVSGIPLSVTACPSERSNRSDARRNLYVLGLPSELNKNELIWEFSRFGKVAHCVILATVDNASRRRGFVVMSSHEEARSAMEGISRSNINGHVVDVSWAVVQRSRGFLDGGDRVMALEARPDVAGHLAPPNTFPPDALEFCHFQSQLSTSALLVKNLPKLLFSSVSDLDPLLRPFGSVSTVDLKTDTGGNSSTAVVKFDSFEDAQEAKARLDGQVYAGFTLKLEHMPSAMPSPAVQQSPSIPPWALPSRNSTPLASSRSKNLNPLATPFIHEQPRGALVTLASHGAISKNASSRNSEPYTPQLHYYEYASSYVPPSQTALRYNPPFDYAMHAPVIPNTLDAIRTSRYDDGFSPLPWAATVQRSFLNQPDSDLYV